MAKYLLKRILVALVTLIGITVIDYWLMNLAGDPVKMMAGPKANAAALALKAEELGMDQPVIVRYFRWLSAVLHGDLGISYKSYEAVSDMIASHLGPTLALMGTALLVSLAIAVFFGIYSAVHQHTKRDRGLPVIWVPNIITQIS